MDYYVFFSLLLVLPLYFIFTRSKRVSLIGKRILITGCDSGFGYSLALWCSEQGMEVLATCLEQGGEAWNNMKIKGIHTMKLDLTNLDSAETESEINRTLENKGSCLFS